MSYPAIKEIIASRNINLETASEEQLEECLWEAFQTNLPDGVAWVKNLAEQAVLADKKVLLSEDPNSALGKQIARLLGTDIARGILQKKFGVAFGFYNCCSGAAAPRESMLKLSAREQVMFQNGVLAHADC